MDEMAFFKLYSDMEQLFEPYSMEERGKLFTALMTYAYHGEDTVFSGNERFLWPVLRRHLDACAVKSQKNTENGSKGGRPRKAKETEQIPNKTDENPEKANETEEKPIKEKEKEKEYEKEKEKLKEEAEEESAPSPQQQPTASQNKTSGIGSADLFGEFLSDDFGNLENLHEAETLLKKYRMSVNDSNVERVVGWINSKGLKTVQDAFRKASDADNRGGLSMNFLDAVINNPSPSGNGTKTGSKWNGQDYTQRSAEERKAAFSAATVEL